MARKQKANIFDKFLDLIGIVDTNEDDPQGNGYEDDFNTGRNSGKGIAHGVTPQSNAMTEGITAAINSCGRMPHDKFAGGASTMWDFDSSWASEPVIEALIRTFIEKGGQIFQGNTTPLEELLDAQKNPEDHPQLIVRVGGYSARFVTLSAELQEDIINRIRHSS